MDFGISVVFIKKISESADFWLDKNITVYVPCYQCISHTRMFNNF